MIPFTNQMQQAQGIQNEYPACVGSELLAIIQHHQRRQRENPGCSGPEYTLVCENCKHLFQAPTKLSGQQRTSFEYESLRRVLMITDYTVLPVFCDACYEQAVVPPEQRAMSFPNLVLKLDVQPPRG